MRLADICEINPKADLISDEMAVSFVAMQDVSEDGKINTATVRPYQEVKKGFTFFREGDVLFAKITPCMENGKGALAVGLENGIGCGSTELYVLRPKSDVINGAWLYYLTAWPVFRVEAERNMTGSAGQKRVPKMFLEKYEVNVPSLDAQKHQVDLLNCVRDIIDLRRKQLAELDDLIKARFVEMFDRKYNTVLLGDVIKTTSGGTPSKSHSEYYEGGTIPWLTSGEVNAGVITSVENNITEQGMRNSSAKMVPENSVVIAMYGATAGVTGLLRVATTTNQAVCSLLPNDRFIPEYLYYAVASKKEWMISQCKGGGQPNISQGIIKSLELIAAPMEAQEKFTKIVEQVDKSKLAVQKALDEAQLLFDSLMQKYFG